MFGRNYWLDLIEREKKLEELRARREEEARQARDSTLAMHLRFFQRVNQVNGANSKKK